MLPISKGLYPRLATSGLHPVHPTCFTSLQKSPLVPRRFCMATPHIPQAMIRFPLEEDIFKHLVKHQCTKGLHPKINAVVAHHFGSLRIAAEQTPERVKNVIDLLPTYGILSPPPSTSKKIKQHVALAMLDNLATVEDIEEGEFD